MVHRHTLSGACLLLMMAIATPTLSAEAFVASETLSEDATTYNLYFGDLHNHTSYSDGTGDPWQAYQMAIDGGADFLAITEHVTEHLQIFRNAPGDKGWVIDAEEWEDLKAAAEYYTSEDFVAMPAYEYGLQGGNGEINVYNVSELPLKDGLGYMFDRLPGFYDWLSEQAGGVGQFNHPLYVTDDFMDYDFYNELRDANMGAIEAYNDEYYEPSYQKALDAGWHLMPTANADVHGDDWIVGHEMRSVLLATELTPDALYDAMRSHRGYGTLDKNLRIEYTLDGAIMGESLSAADGEYTAWIRISDPDGLQDEITLVEIVTDYGVVAASIPTSGNSVEFTVELKSEDSRYFYVRVTTVSPLNGDIEGVTAWTSPVWTGP